MLSSLSVIESADMLKRYLMACLAGGVLFIIYLLLKTSSFAIGSVPKAVVTRTEDSNVMSKTGSLFDEPATTTTEVDINLYSIRNPHLGPLFNISHDNIINFKHYPYWNSSFTFRQNSNWKNSTCTESLQKKAFTSKDFGQIFRPDIQMLINSDLFDVNEYRRLKRWTIPYGYEYRGRSIMYEEVGDTLKMFPSEDSIFKVSREGQTDCISCAVVGNGGILNGSRMGKEIDEHDFVFRVNQAYTRGYEDDVGSRTTHFVFFDRSLTLMKLEHYPVGQNITYIFVPCREADYSYLRTIGNGTNVFKAPPENVRVIHPDFMRYVHFVWMRVDSFRPTTGGIMTMVALHACDKLSLYGMGYNYKYSNHYFDTRYQEFLPVLLSHDHTREIKLWDTLDKEGIVYWYRRDVF
ncbi:alpha-N-acetylgalactosaminide alpha-2,6-sialyltransferase 2-like [Branchiostoma floridae]|uniref:alpha-N-acetylgalactosaminide alpha-2,6-sialyltransferase n=1 Tax=Branchiostoma floridae TaxID=7739 RepID=A0A9J7HSR5_BRAFL|nr:alpha-N-acetylgalactosaminide alpha-2,6-sialyltransferase 2-like [Branchiostoma floridae]